MMQLLRMARSAGRSFRREQAVPAEAARRARGRPSGQSGGSDVLMTAAGVGQVWGLIETLRPRGY